MPDHPPPDLGGKVVCTGLSSRTTDDKHVLFWDLDYPDTAAEATSMGEAILGIRRAQRQHDLPPTYLVDAGHPTSWHAICPHKVSILHAQDILRTHPDADPSHARVGDHLGRWILRITPKAGDETPHVEHVIHPTHPLPEDPAWDLSRPHIRFLDEVLDGPTLADEVPESAIDAHSELEWEHYATTSTRTNDTNGHGPDGDDA